MTTHDLIVERIAVHHRDLGDAVYAKASGLKDFPEPPTYRGRMGGTYQPDVYVENRDIIYRVKPHFLVRSEIFEIRAFMKARPNEIIIVLSTGNDMEVTEIKKTLSGKGIDYPVIHYKNLSFWE